MASSMLSGLSQLIFGLFQVAAYGLVFSWALHLLEDLRLERYFSPVRLYHLLVPALVLTSLAVVPIRFVLDLLASFFAIFSPSWVFSAANFLSGVALVLWANHLVGGYRKRATSTEK